MKYRDASLSYGADKVSDETGLECKDPSLAQQNFKEECDINTVVKRFGITGQLPVNADPLTYGDFSEVMDFRSAMDAVVLAQNRFMAMPADVRARFSNDPQKFVEFCSNAENLEEMRKLGLAVPKVPAVASGVADGAGSGVAAGS